MSVKHLFIREHDGSACKGGFCAKDARCRDRSCEGHPLGYEAGFLPLQNADGGAQIDTEIEMYETAWDVIARLAQRTAGWAVLVCFAGGLVWLFYTLKPPLVVALRSVGFPIF